MAFTRDIRKEEDEIGGKSINMKEQNGEENCEYKRRERELKIN